MKAVSLLVSVAILSFQTCIVRAAGVPTVCRGTNYGVLTSLYGSTPSERLARLRARYSGCQLVAGNVEIFGISNSADLDFLKDIEEITGYMLVYQTERTALSVPNLVLIRGNPLFNDSVSGRSAGLAVLDNGRLEELHVPNLREISAGVVVFRGNPSICYINTIRWDDILETPLVQSIGLNLTATGCAGCNVSCNGTCWGPDTCQAPLSKVICPEKCKDPFSSRCAFDSKNNDFGCCHAECSAGCLSPANPVACQYCQHFEDLTAQPYGRCEPNCPADTIEWSVVSLCAESCTAPLVQTNDPKVCSESCPCDRVLQDCNFRKFDEVAGQCQKTTPPTMVCQGVEGVGPILHKGNIDSFVNCEVVQGSIHIDHLSFTGDALNGIQALTVADLNKLSHVTEIEGYLAVTNTTQMDFNSLQFLESLHAIRGRFTPFGGRYSLYIVGNSHLRSLRTTALERIDRGDVKITDNGQLCYVDTVNWTEIARALLTNGSNGIEVTNNQNRTICDEQGDTCHVECNGCWFMGPTDCVSCHNHEFQGICVSECNLQMDGSCGPCDDVCTQFCNGPTGFNCTSDGLPGSECKYLIEGEQCVQTCSVGTYEYVFNRTCLACPSICHIDKNPSAGPPIGCSGASFFQGPGGCDRCEKIGDVESKMCIDADDTCPNGTYEGSVAFGSVAFGSGSVPACQRCTTGCSKCTGPGLTINICKRCTDLLEENTCVPRCSGTHYKDPNSKICQKCHPQCDLCRGPLATDCSSCKNSRFRKAITVTDPPITGRVTTNPPTTQNLTSKPNSIMMNTTNSTLSTLTGNVTANPPTTQTLTSKPVSSLFPSNSIKMNTTNSTLTEVNTTSCTGVNCSTSRPSPLPTTVLPTPKTITVTQCIAKCPSDKLILDIDDFCVSKCSAGTFNSNNKCEHCSPLCDQSMGCTTDKPDSCEGCRELTRRNLDGTTECVERCPDLFDIMLVNDSVCLQFNATVPPTNASVQEPPAEKASTIGIAVGGAVGGLVFLAAVSVAVYLVYRHLTEPKDGVIAHMLELVQVELPPDEEGKLELIYANDLEIGDKLGTGCFGTVYKGYWHPPDQKLKIPVSIKMLNESLSPKQSKELMQEGVRMASSNPNVLRILGICFSDNVTLISQFCPFGCLLNFLRRQKRNLTAMALMTYSVQVATAMDFLEKRGLVHGNLACRNVLVLKPNQVRITDYGLSNLVTRTIEGQPLAWMSPESIEKNIFTHQSDVWSFGVTLWELMTFGGVPYRNKVGQDLLAILQAGERLQQPKTVTIEVYALMLQCWIIEDASRPCFEDIARELDNLRRDPARYVLTANVDEAVADDRSATMRSLYSDSIPMDGEYAVEFNPDVQRALYEDPDAYEGFLQYEDPDKLLVPDSDDVKKSNGDVTGYENPHSTLKQESVNGGIDVTGYENPPSTLKRDSLNGDVTGLSGYENPGSTLKQENVCIQNPYETLQTDKRDKTSIYEKPLHVDGEDEQGPGYDLPAVGGGASDTELQSACSIFDEPGYESVGSASEPPSRIGSKQQQQHQFESDTMQLHEPSPDYEDPTTVISTAPSKEGHVTGITQPKGLSDVNSEEMDDMDMSDHYQDPGEMLGKVEGDG